MEAPVTSAKADEDLLVLRSEIRVGARVYQAGDRFDLDRLLSRGDIDQRTATILRRQNAYGPLTREAYELIMVRRPGEIGRGWTFAYLKAKGIIDKEPDPAAKPKRSVVAAGKQEKQPAKPRQMPEAEDYKGFKIVPVQVGNFTQFEVLDDEGHLLRAERFRKKDTAHKFIDSRLNAGPAVEREIDKDLTKQPQSTDEPRSGTSGEGTEGQSNGGDVQPGSDGPDQPG